MESASLSQQYVKNQSREGRLPPNLAETLSSFFLSYERASLDAGSSSQAIQQTLKTYVDQVITCLNAPSPFQHVHQAIRSPFDYYAFGIDFFRPLIDQQRSLLLGKENLEAIGGQLKREENVILMANHQTESDPQVMGILLEPYLDIFDKTFFVAGNRVTEDPLAVPFSMGCNLICIYSKKYLDIHPSDKERKLLHNQRSLKELSKLLDLGGCCIYVALSGGRDRKNEQGQIEVAPFDPQSLEMFWLLGERAAKKTHFYPLALATYDILPPPDGLLVELGESRKTKQAPAGLSFGPEIERELFQKMPALDKKEYRKAKSELICAQVKEQYHDLTVSLLKN
ncbi:MAG: plsB [Chlamydiales bacterium]|jgi:glycerol-3-phosphate O-acyltransferase|nr:plsB [Chlamydiales bacterium]